MDQISRQYKKVVRMITQSQDLCQLLQVSVFKHALLQLAVSSIYAVDPVLDFFIDCCPVGEVTGNVQRVRHIFQIHYIYTLSLRDARLA